MSGPAELSIAAGVVLDAGLKATVVLGAGGVAGLLLRRRSAAARHAVWAVTLGALALLPLIASTRGPEIAVDRPWVVVLWAVGVVVAAAPLGRGLLSLARWGRGSSPGLRIIESDAVQSPLTWGFWRPTVLMPASAQTWDPAHRDAALAHELAHVRRGDWLVHVLAHAIAALFWFHPLVWLARRQLALEAEHAADDDVLSTGIAPSAYAELLVCLARGRSPDAALGAGSHVGARVYAILDHRARCPRRAPAILFAMVVTAVTVPALAAWPAWSAPEEALTCQPELLP